VSVAKKTSFDVGKYYQHYPRIAVIITARSGEKENAMAASWNSPLSMVPPLFGVAITPKRFTYKLILESGEFGVCFVPLEKAELIAQVGAAKGSETDKFDAFNIAREDPVRTSVPLLKDAYLSYECKVEAHYTLGDHEWFVGKIVAVHQEEGILNRRELLDLRRVKPALYLGADRYITTAPRSQLFIDREPIRRKYGGGTGGRQKAS
jgi:flavin reductase (DIM6/NTAB) family NADH-FMN oxidoreductase RutF